MHILPHLHSLERSFPQQGGLVVIGVHSAKFDNEKDERNISNAILRYGITHPVVNDNEMVLWNSMKIECWPTLVLIDPMGKPIMQLVGESNIDLLPLIVDVALTYYKELGQIRYPEIASFCCIDYEIRNEIAAEFNQFYHCIS